MYEVELKIPADVEAIRARLRDEGAERTSVIRQVDTYYNAPDRDFAETDEALRLRDEAPINEASDTQRSTTKVTYKGPLLDDSSKTRAEHETEVADRETMASILDGLGYTPAATVEKRREFYTYGAYTVLLDRVQDLGEFVEIEREVDREAAIGSAREGAKDALRDLGIDPSDQIRTSYLGLLLAANE